LESDPMQTNRETKRADRGDSAGAAQHDCEANHHLVSCQLSPARFQRRFARHQLAADGIQAGSLCSPDRFHTC
jgi:hypothetical protein